MDDGETLHQRRNWISQYQLENMNEVRTKIHQRSCNKKLSKVSSFAHESFSFVKRHGRRSVFAIVILALMALNLNQGPNLHQNIIKDNIINKSTQKHNSLRSLERHDSSTTTTYSHCKKTPFVTPPQATYSMPMTPEWYIGELPSHIALCQELIRRNEIATNAKSQEGGIRNSPFTKFTVHEPIQVCADWSKPHSVLMQIISSSVIAFVGQRFGLEYSHNCHQTLNAKYRDVLDFDVTTVQQIFPQLAMPINQNKLSIGEVAHELCTACIDQYNNNPGAIGAYDETHHCLAFPDRGTVRVDSVNEQITGRNNMPEMVEMQEVLDSNGYVVHTALESVLPLVRNRLWHETRDWLKNADVPTHDPQTGAVIYLDAGKSLPIPFYLYAQQIPQHTTRISILSGPDCAEGKMAISMSKLQPLQCLKHGLELRDYLQNALKDVGVEVTFDLVSSTATSFSRMIMTNTLICPPETLSCLFPILAKEKYKNAIVFESPESSTSNWFTYLGTSATNINIIRVTPDQLQDDRAQQYIEAKYADFSADAAAGAQPRGAFRLSPLINPFLEDGSSNTSNTDNEQSSTDMPIGNFKSNSDNFVTQSGPIGTSLSDIPDIPELNPTFETTYVPPNNIDSEERVQASETDVFKYRVSNGLDPKYSIVNDNGADIQQVYYEVVHDGNDSNEEKTNTKQTESDVLVPDEDAYKLVGEESKPEETSFSSFEESRISKGSAEETNLNIDYKTAFENTDGVETGNFFNDPDEAMGRSNTNEMLNYNGLTNGNHDDPTKETNANNDETDLDINYNSLFENW